MNNSLKIFPGSIIALLMGVCVASPLLILNLGTISPTQTGIKPEIEVDVAYAYFDILSANQNVTGLWRSSSNTRDNLPIVAYLFVLNITNDSNHTVEIDLIGVSAQKGPYLNFTEIINQNKTITPNYPILSDYTHFADAPEMITFDNTLEAKQSRLIGVSGIQTVWSVPALEALKTGQILLFAQTSAMVSGSSRSTSGIVDNVKQVQLEIFENEYLYNTIVSENQLLKISTINGIDVTIESRS